MVAGLWDVDDRSTAELMDQLYAGLAAGESAGTGAARGEADAAAPGRRDRQAVLLGALRTLYAVAVTTETISGTTKITKITKDL